jgi:hypothetical protein
MAVLAALRRRLSDWQRDTADPLTEEVARAGQNEGAT